MKLPSKELNILNNKEQLKFRQEFSCSEDIKYSSFLNIQAEIVLTNQSEDLRIKK